MTVDNSLIHKLDEIRDLLISDKLLIPLSILANRKFSPLQAIVYYLREKRHMKNIKIARILKRNPRTITQAYTQAKRKK